VTKIKKRAYEQTSGKVKKRSITRTTNNSEVSDSCSVDVSDISECEGVPKSAPDVLVGNQDVAHDLYSSATFEEENTERLNKEPRTVLCEGNKSFLVTGGDGVGIHEKSNLLNGSARLAINNVISSNVDDDDCQLHMQHPSISFSDQNIPNLNIPPAKCHDKHVESSDVLEHPVLEAENLAMEIPIADDKEQLVAKEGQEKPKHCHDVSVFSSPDEVVETDGCQKQLESPEQTTGNGKSCVQVLKGK